MNYWIRQLGFWGYMKQFPVNPITLVGSAVFIGIVVLFLNAALRKRGAGKFLMEHPGAAIMTFQKLTVGNPDYADNIRLEKLNNETPRWFFIKPAIPAIYLPVGESKLVLHADWARQGGGAIKKFKSKSVEITVCVESEGHYSLEYHIADDKFIFEKLGSAIR